MLNAAKRCNFRHVKALQDLNCSRRSLLLEQNRPFIVIAWLNKRKLVEIHVPVYTSGIFRELAPGRKNKKTLIQFCE